MQEDGVGEDCRYGNSPARDQDAEVKKEFQNHQVQSVSCLFIVVAPFLQVQIVSMHQVWFVQEERVEERWRHENINSSCHGCRLKIWFKYFFPPKKTGLQTQPTTDMQDLSFF